MLELQLEGMSCGGCVSSVTRALRALDSSATVEVDLATQRVRVDGNVDAAQARQALDDAGYPVLSAQEA